MIPNTSFQWSRSSSVDDKVARHRGPGGRVVGGRTVDGRGHSNEGPARTGKHHSTSRWLSSSVESELQIVTWWCLADVTFCWSTRYPCLYNILRARFFERKCFSLVTFSRTSQATLIYIVGWYELRLKCFSWLLFFEHENVFPDTINSFIKPPNYFNFRKLW